MMQHRASAVVRALTTLLILISTITTPMNLLFADLLARPA